MLLSEASPTWTAGANSVGVLIARKRRRPPHQRVTSDSGAISSIPSSSRSWRALTTRTVAQSDSNGGWVARAASRGPTSQPSQLACRPGQACSAGVGGPVAQQQLGRPVPGHVRSPRQSSRARTRPRAASCSTDGIETEVLSCGRQLGQVDDFHGVTVLTRSPRQGFCSWTFVRSANTGHDCRIAPTGGPCWVPQEQWVRETRSVTARRGTVTSYRLVRVQDGSDGAGCLSFGDPGAGGRGT